MNYSYVMGMDDCIMQLKEHGFFIEKDGCNYTVSFPKDKSSVYEDFVCSHLQVGYWNEYIQGDLVVFLFHLPDGIKRYEVLSYQNSEVLALCEKLCECKFQSIYSMLKGNHFYSKYI